jgi:hypothetical protein
MCQLLTKISNLQLSFSELQVFSVDLASVFSHPGHAEKAPMLTTIPLSVGPITLKEKKHSPKFEAFGFH